MQDYLENKRNLQTALLNFFDNEYNYEENYQNLIKYFKDHKISEDPIELKTTLHLILKISKDHQRTPHFFSKIEKILKYFKSNISSYFSQYCIFNMFRSNKRILLFLIEEKMIIVDKNIADTMADYSYKNEKYIHYFYPEIKNFINENIRNRINEEIKQFEKNYDQNFEEKRKIGENDNYICKLIQNDSIDEFITFVNQQNWSLKANIEISIYETNSYLHKINPTLIEYAAFFGSEQIFKYLLKNGAELTNSVWIFAVHGRSPEIFNILEEEFGQPTGELYNECLNESIKCHNIDVTNYILNNYQEISENEKNEENFIKSIKYYNYCFFPTEISNYNDEQILYDLCKYNHSRIVELIMNTQKINSEANKLLTIATEKKNKEIIQVIIRYNGITPYSFYSCRELCEIAIPSSVKSIDDYAFADCINLKQVSIPFSVTSIGKESFSMCSSLKQITIPSSVTEIGEGCFYGCSSIKYVKIPSSVTKIGESAFRWCLSLVEVIMPNSIKSIGMNAFMACSSLEKIEIPNSLQSINNHCFSFCQSLVKIVIPPSVTFIGDFAFYACSSLKSVVIPSSVTSIGEEAFSGCSELKDFAIPSTVIEIKKDAFKGFTLLDQTDVLPSVDSSELGILVQ